ncbi:MAG: hypothetical protein O2962_08975 [Cyanobacteria bacterium]|nr:hypothetical protein [Cyanobacteriota bacterium]
MTQAIQNNQSPIEAAAIRLAARADQAEASLPLAERTGARMIGEQIGIPAIRFTKRTDRDDPRADMREVVTLQIQLDKIMAEVKDFQSSYQQGDKADDLILRLETLYRAIDINLQIKDSDWDAAGIKDYIDTISKEAKKQTDRLKDIRYDPDAKKERSDISDGLIETYKFNAKLRIKQAQLLLQEKDQAGKSANQACQNIMPILIQSDIACDKLKQELNWRKNRSDTVARTQEMQTLDALGQTIWGIDLDKLDIKYDGNQTTIRQQVWIRPRAYIATIVKDLKANDNESAIERLDHLLGLYTNQHSPHLLSNHKAIQEGVQAIKEIITQVDEEAVNTDQLKDIREKIKTIQALVIPADQAHAIYKDYVFDKDPAAGLRSRVYILRNNKDDFDTVAKTIAYLENLAGNDSPGRRSVYDIPGLLTMAAKTMSLTKADKETIDKDIQTIIDWAQRGKVYPKQFAKNYLEHIPAMIQRGYDQQKANPIEAARQYRKAAAEINKAVNKLRPRLNDIIGISQGTKRKFDSLLVEYKDMDIKSRSTRMLELFQNQQYDDVLAEIQKLRDLYFRYLAPEPGYKRIANNLARIEHCTRKATSQGDQRGHLLNDIKYYTQLMSLDIDHKNTLRLSVYNLDSAPARAEFIYPPVKVHTEADLLSWLQREHISLRVPKTEEERGFRGKTDKLLEDEEEYLVCKTEVTGLTPAIKLGRAEIPQLI